MPKDEGVMIPCM